MKSLFNYDKSGEIKHTPQALEKSVHTCYQEGCGYVNYYRQAKRIDIQRIIENDTIKHFQSLFIIKSESNKHTSLIKYYLRITEIIYKTGGIGIFKDNNNSPVFGCLSNTYYSIIGDIIKFDINTYIYGFNNENIYFSFNYIKDHGYFAIELPQKQGIKDQYFPIITSLNDAFDNIRINQDNAMIKFWTTTTGENDFIFRMLPSVDNRGLAIFSKQKIVSKYSKPTNVEPPSDIVGALKERNEFNIEPYDYTDATDSAWKNFSNTLNFYNKLVGIRETKEIKKANLTNSEVQTNNFSYDLKENYALQIIQELIYKWNELFNEDNIIEKITEIEYGGLENVLL